MKRKKLTADQCAAIKAALERKCAHPKEVSSTLVVLNPFGLPNRPFTRAYVGLNKHEHTFPQVWDIVIKGTDIDGADITIVTSVALTEDRKRLIAETYLHEVDSPVKTRWCRAYDDPIISIPYP